MVTTCGQLVVDLLDCLELQDPVLFGSLIPTVMYVLSVQIFCNW